MLSNHIKIPNKEITFVLQVAPIIHENEVTRKSCESIKSTFLESKLILSKEKFKF